MVTETNLTVQVWHVSVYGGNLLLVVSVILGVAVGLFLDVHPRQSVFVVVCLFLSSTPLAMRLIDGECVSVCVCVCLLVCVCLCVGTRLVIIGTSSVLYLVWHNSIILRTYSLEEINSLQALKQDVFETQ